MKLHTLTIQTKNYFLVNRVRSFNPSGSLHCVKSVRIRSFFWSAFSPNSGKYGPEKLQIRTFFKQFIALSWRISFTTIWCFVGLLWDALWKDETVRMLCGVCKSVPNILLLPKWHSVALLRMCKKSMKRVKKLCVKLTTSLFLRLQMWQKVENLYIRPWRHIHFH